MNVEFISEPSLEFNGGFHHIDIRTGIRRYGPFDVALPSKAQTIRLGVIGTSASAAALIEWLRKCESGVVAKQSFQPNLFPSFSGYGSESPFKASLITEARTTRELSIRAITDLARIDDAGRLLEEAVGLFIGEISYLAGEAKVDVIVCALPFELLDALSYIPATNSDAADATEVDEEPRATRSRHNFRAMLKARAMKSGIPLQVVLPTTYGLRQKRVKREARQTRPGFGDPLLSRSLQDEATRAWNFFTALYYKGGGTPWRLSRDSAALSSCFVGIGFYKSADDQHLVTSAAQVFDERGDGQIVRGAAAFFDKDDRTPHLESGDMKGILERALAAYYAEHKNYPARVVLHKSSYFTPGERDGARAAAQELRISRVDMLSIRTSRLRLFRDNAYPPLRGSAWNIDDSRTVLYTRGSVPFFETYPGMYIPRAIDIRFDDTETAPNLLMAEILSLTKMNWNSTQFDHSSPITLEAADHTGGILKHLRDSDDDIQQSSYRFYM